MGETLADVQIVVQFILSLWGVAALILGPIAFFKLRAFFPERGETISPATLRAELDALAAKMASARAEMDRETRDDFTAEFGRLRAAIDENHAEMRGLISAVESRAGIAHELARQASHKTELLELRLESEYRLLIEKMEHIKTAIGSIRSPGGRRVTDIEQTGSGYDG